MQIMKMDGGSQIVERMARELSSIPWVSFTY